MQIPDWFYKPEVIYTTVLTVLACIVSLYPAEIKLFIKLFLVKPWGTVRKLRLTGAVNQLAQLDHLYQNAYNLILYLLYESGSALLFCGSLYLITEMFRRTYHTRDWKYIIAGVLFGRVFNMYVVIANLAIYDRKRVQLEKRIAKFKGSPISRAA